MTDVMKELSPFPIGGKNPVSQYFTGRTFLASLTGPDAQTDIANVTFEPGCRNNCTSITAVSRSLSVSAAKAGIRNGERNR